MSQNGQPLTIEIWSDFVCPFCYIGKRNLEAALRQFPEKDRIRITWKSFELDPSEDRDPSRSVNERLAEKYGRDLAWAEEMAAQMTATAKTAGLAFDFDRAVPANTFHAHRLAQFAAIHDRQDAAEERLMAAYFTEGRDLGNVSVLESLALEIGLPADETRTTLQSDAFAVQVRKDESEAYSLGIRAVPFYVFNREAAVRGAQPAEAFLEALRLIAAKAPGGGVRR